MEINVFAFVLLNELELELVVSLSHWDLNRWLIGVALNLECANYYDTENGGNILSSLIFEWISQWFFPLIIQESGVLLPKSLTLNS